LKFWKIFKTIRKLIIIFSRFRKRLKERIILQKSLIFSTIFCWTGLREKKNKTLYFLQKFMMNPFVNILYFQRLTFIIERILDQQCFLKNHRVTQGSRSLENRCLWWNKCCPGEKGFSGNLLFSEKPADSTEQVFPGYKFFFQNEGLAEATGKHRFPR
jgi:hypothetical protein